MRLAEDERALLEGQGGAALQKVMRSIVMYGEALGAERLVAIEAGGHSSAHVAIPGIGFPMPMLEELVAAGLKTTQPFTLDPAAPLDFENLFVSPEERDRFLEMFADQPRYDVLMASLGLRDGEAWTCTPYLPEVGNIPGRGEVLAWSESSCVVYANSVLAARTSRNAAIMDLLCNIVGKVPLTGLLTDEGRRARWLVDVRTARLPDPQLLGAVIGGVAGNDVPYIAGLDRFLGPELSPDNLDYLKEMGAACAAIGAVGLYHAERMTPEAVEQGRALLEAGHRTCVVDDETIRAHVAAQRVMWERPDAPAQRCLIGCPHLSLRELAHWSESIREALRVAGRDRVAIPTTLFAAPQVIRRFEAEGDREALRALGVGLSPACAESFMDNQLVAHKRVITSSNKLRAFTTARMLPEPQILGILAGRDAARGRSI